MKKNRGITRIAAAIALVLSASTAGAGDIATAIGGGVGAAGGAAVGQAVGGKTGALVGGAVGGAVGGGATTQGKGKTGAMVGGALGGAAGAAVGQSVGGKSGAVVGAGAGGAAGAVIGKNVSEGGTGTAPRASASRGGSVAYPAQPRVVVSTGFDDYDEHCGKKRKHKHHRGKGHAKGHYKC